jgi:hypothetical protein
MSIYNPPEVKDPFEEYLEEEYDSILIDLTEKLDTKEKDTIKVRLRQLSNSVVVKKKYGPPDLEIYKSMVPSKSAIEGILVASNLPQENSIFKLNYYMFDGLLEFGLLESSAPVTNVEVDENIHFFKDKEGLWRLEVVTDYN